MLPRTLTMRIGIALLFAASPAYEATASDCNQVGTGMVPLTDLGAGTYLDAYAGGLYEGGSNAVPTDHRLAGLARAAAVAAARRHRRARSGRQDRADLDRHVQHHDGMVRDRRDSTARRGRSRASPKRTPTSITSTS